MKYSQIFPFQLTRIFPEASHCTGDFSKEAIWMILFDVRLDLNLSRKSIVPEVMRFKPSSEFIKCLGVLSNGKQNKYNSFWNFTLEILSTAFGKFRSSSRYQWSLAKEFSSERSMLFKKEGWGTNWPFLKTSICCRSSWWYKYRFWKFPRYFSCIIQSFFHYLQKIFFNQKY